MRLSTPPRLVARMKILTFAATARAASLPAADDEGEHAAARAHLAGGEGVAGIAC